MHGAILRDLNEPAPQDVLQIGRGGGGWMAITMSAVALKHTHTRALLRTRWCTHTLPPSLSLSQANAQATLPLTVTYQMKKAQ